MRDMPPPILLTGCARSGTSLTAGIVHLCGAFGGIMSGPNPNNKKGMFENTTIRQKVIKPYLRDLGVDPLGQYPLPFMNRLKPFDGLEDRIRQILISQNYKGGIWMYKGAKMCLIWPEFHKAYPDAKWLILRRNDADIINSCMKTSFMRAFIHQRNQKAVKAKNEYEGWAWWINQHKKRFQEMHNAGLQIREVWPERMINGDYKQIHDVINWLGLQWNETAKNFIDPKLWKAKQWKDRQNGKSATN